MTATGGPATAGGRLAVAWSAAPALATVALGSLWLPWYRTGTNRRSAFRLVAALRSAGLLSRGPAHAYTAVIALAPGLAASAWLLALARLPRLAAAAAGLTGLALAGASIAVLAVSAHRADYGTRSALLLGSVCVVGSGLAGALRLSRPWPRKDRSA